MYKGNYKLGSVVRIIFNTFAQAGESCTVTDLAVGDIHVHKDGGITQRASTSGYALSIDFDGITGNHLITIDTSDNTDADFFQAGHDYSVRLEGITVDTKTLNVWVADFALENRLAEVDVTKWLGTAAATPTVAGVPEVDVTHLNGVTQSLADLKDFADAGYDPSTHKVEGLKLADVCTLNSDMRGTNNAALASGVNVTQLNNDTQSLLDLKDFADANYDPTTHKIESVKVTDNMRGTDNAALETTLTAIKGIGWSTETLKEINTSIGNISISGGDASSAKQDIIIGKIENMQDHGDIYWVASGTVSGSTTIKNLRYCEVLHAGIYHDVMIGVADLDNVDMALQTWALETLGEYLDLPAELIKNQNLNDLLVSKEINTSVYVDA